MSNEGGWKTRAELEHQIIRLVHRDFSQRQIAVLASDPSFADRIDTTSFDHVAADLIASARTLLRDIAALADPA